MAPSPETILVAAIQVAAGKSVGFIGAQGIVHHVIPHEATHSVSNTEFFDPFQDTLIASHGSALSEAEMWAARSGLLYDLGWKEESLECDLRAISLDPMLTAAWVNLGRYFMDPEIHDYDLASLCLDKALEIQPEHDMALANRAGVAIAQDRLQLAVDLGERAIRANDRNFYAHCYYAGAHLELSNHAAKERELSFIRVALRHYRRCRLLVDKPEAGPMVDELIRWCEEKLHTA
jgi:tetratricopeptide (TPR) repeat protein